MRLNHSMKLSFTFVALVFLFIGLILPGNVRAVTIDTVDGFWTDSFADPNTTKCLPNGTSQCVWENNQIHLIKSSQGGRNYTYAGGGADSHRAWYDTSFFRVDGIFWFLFTPNRFSKNEFDDTFDYPYIINRHESNNTYTRYAITEAKGLKKNVIHHFRMTLEGTADSIGNLTIYWYGKADNAHSIEMYYWKYGYRNILGHWKKLNVTTSVDNVSFRGFISVNDLAKALDFANNIDLCVVAYGEVSTTCRLYTDAVWVQSSNQVGYKIGYGLVQTNSTIDLPPSGYWEFLTWDDFTSGSATATYQVLYNKSGKYVPIEDSILSGNAHGFATPPVSLVALGGNYPHIKLQGNLSTRDPTQTPRLFSWTVTWQTGNQWQDHFHSEYRVAVEDNVNVNVEQTIYNGSVNISLVSGNWWMFGQNPSNTRAASGSAAFSRDLYWWSSYHELKGETPLTLLLDSNALYVAITNNTQSNGSVYRYSPVIIPANKTTGQEYGEVNGYRNIKDFVALTYKKKTLVGSPALSDQFLVVATGDRNSHNYVYAFTKDQTRAEPVWTFDYSSINPIKPTICYWGSPIIAQGHVYLASWSGDTMHPWNNSNNMIIALDLLTGNTTWMYSFPESSKPERSPTWSFSTPAYSEGKIVVGCMNDLSDNLFALDAEKGTLLWNTSVGAIGKAAPVIYKNIVYVVNENKSLDGLVRKAMLSAINLDDGSIRWQVPLGKRKYAGSTDPTFTLAQTTPAIANGILYVTSPDWYLTAFDLSKNNTALWSLLIPGGTLTGPMLTSSPAYVDGVVYVGTPAGKFWAYNVSDHRQLWNFSTHNDVGVATDPIVSNGLVFFADEHGRLYVCGRYVQPNTQINGSIISVPIQLPQGFWWSKFHASALTNQSTSVNQITFSLLDANNNIIKTLTDGSDLTSPNRTLGRTIRLRADFWAKNSTMNPRLLLWNVMFIQDFVPPFFDRNSLTPRINLQQWLNEVVPQFTIQVKDNLTGLLVSSARFTLGYDAHNVTRFYSGKASCTGVNGTTQVQVMTVNLSSLDFYQNITALHSLQFNISDLAGNPQTLKIFLKQDMQKPTSHILTQSIKNHYNMTNPFIWINATAQDVGTNASGVAEVQLYYRYSHVDNFTGDWIVFGNSSSRTPHFRFGFTDDPSQQGGYFELTTIAIDNATNRQDFPAKGDVSFLYDWTIPDLPSLSGETLWFNTQPQLSATFTDDFRLDTVQYRPNFDTTWTTLASRINTSSYQATWQLTKEYWDRMQSGQVYYLYFKMNDTSGNTRFVSDSSNALIIRKDIEKPNVTIEVPGAHNHLLTSRNFTVSAFADDFNGSGISSVALYYQYSKDNRGWTQWIHYEDNLTTAPFEWTFTTPKGDGYYRFQTTALDFAGNEAQSAVFSSGVIRLPVDMVLVMVALVLVLLLIGGFLYQRWRKRK